MRHEPVRIFALFLAALVVVPVAGPAGERAAWADLGSFLLQRGWGYRQHLSSPLTAEAGCSRLSAHLSFGSISMRCVHQATEARMAALRERDEPGGPRKPCQKKSFFC